MKPPTSLLARWALWPLSVLYRVGAWLHLAAYRSGWLSREHISVPVVSVGNLSVGGTGKTPLVARICSLLAEQGKRTAVVSRGYKRRAGSDLIVVSRGDGKGPVVDVATAGDEPYLLARALPDSAVVVATRRADGARLAAEELGVDVVVTDDGYQHHQLARDVDLLVMDATEPTGSGWVVPAGALREPLHAASRASALVLSHCDVAPETAPIEALFHRYNPTAPVFHMVTRLQDIVLPDGRQVNPEDLSGERVLAFCGIGKPELFRQDLLRAGLELVVFAPFSDHHWYTDDDLKALSRQAKDAGAMYWLTTEKDFVRLSHEQQRSYPIGRLRIVVEILEAQEFRGFLMSALQTGSAE